MIYDVLILGGGPAGTAAGLTLLKRVGTEVAVVERSNYERPRIGESLSPGTRPLLDYLGVWDAFQQEQPMDAYGSQAAWGRAEVDGLDYMFTLHGTGWSLDRRRFDKMLADSFERRGGDLFTGTQVRACNRDGDLWQVQVRDKDGAKHSLTARYLIDACGRRGLPARRLETTRTLYDDLVGVAGTGEQVEPLTASILVEACPYGWWYSTPIPGNRVSVVLMSDADIVHRLKAAGADTWQQLLAKTTHTAQRVQGVTFDGSPHVFSARTALLQQAGGNDWVAVGDALASHDPLSSSGIPHALGTGVHGALTAADALFAKGKMLPTYQESIQADFQQYLTTHARYYAREQRWPNQPFWRRRNADITLNPHAVVTQTKTDPVGNATFLARHQQEALLGLCASGHQVHEVVRQFAQANPQIPHQRIILALQELAQCNAVQLEAEAALV